MTATSVDDVFAWEALDSRGRPTVGCRVRLAGGAEGRAVVPSGASTGGYEAVELRDRGDRFGGFGVSAAVRNVNEVLAPAVVGMDAADRPRIDAVMEDIDGTPELGRLGANSVLAVSVAVSVAGARGAGRPLWQELDGGDEPLLPMPMVNIVSGARTPGAPSTSRTSLSSLSRRAVSPRRSSGFGGPARLAPSSWTPVAGRRPSWPTRVG